MEPEERRCFARQIFLLPVGGSQPRWPSCSQDMDRPACPAACPASSRQPAKCHSRELAVPQPSGTAEPGSSSWMLKARPPREAVINRRAQGICSGFTLAGKPGEHPRGPQRNACQEPVTYHACLRAGGESASSFHGKVPKFFKAPRTLACNGNTEQIAL